MDRNPVFIRMRDDHRRVLSDVEILELAIAGPGAVPNREAERLAALLERQFATHMKAEDEILFPALQNALPETADTIDRLRGDHQDLRSMLDGLRRVIAIPSSSARDEQLAIHVRDLADLLRIHIRKEEVLVFQLAERVLPPAEIQRLAARLSPDSSSDSRKELPS